MYIMSDFESVEPSLDFLDHHSTPDEWQVRVQTIGDTWSVNNSNFDAYSAKANVFERPDGLKGLVQALPASENVVGLDLAAGSQAAALTDLLDRGVLTKALATNYDDLRSDELKVDERLSHIEGDLTGPDAWRKIIAWQRAEAPEGFSLIMHRPVGPLQNLSRELYHGATMLMLDMLKSGGILFAQVPRCFSQGGAPGLADICKDVRSRRDVVEVINSKVDPSDFLVPDEFVTIRK
jgi:hypothetical protein